MVILAINLFFLKIKKNITKQKKNQYNIISKFIYDKLGSIILSFNNIIDII